MKDTTKNIIIQVLDSDAEATEQEKNAIRDILGGKKIPVIQGKADRIGIKQAAEILGVSRMTVHRLARDGHLHPVHLSPRLVRYSRRECEGLAFSGVGA